MEPVVKQIHELLTKKHATLAVAESCTGGLTSYLLTKIPGSSKYFILGIVTYSNKAKQNLLKVPESTITKNGAVSAEVALLMAANIRKKAKTDFGIGITGIAGPSGATCQKPIGTVFIAVSSANITKEKRFCFKGNRDYIRKHAALKSLEMLCAHLSQLNYRKK